MGLCMKTAELIPECGNPMIPDSRYFHISEHSPVYFIHKPMDEFRQMLLRSVDGDVISPMETHIRDSVHGLVYEIRWINPRNVGIMLG